MLQDEFVSERTQARVVSFSISIGVLQLLEHDSHCNAARAQLNLV
jgi:hypothetical protein